MRAVILIGLMAMAGTAAAQVPQPARDVRVRPSAPVAKPEPMSDISQEQQLKMQMAMDRKAKADSALSNTMRKSRDTSGTITGNLK